RGDAAVDPHRGAGDGAPPRRPGERRRPARHPPRQAQGHERDGVDDPSLQARDGGAAPAGRRVLRPDGEPQGGEGLLHGERRHVEAGALAHPPAVVRQPQRDPEDGGGAPPLGRDRDQRQHRHRDGRDRPV
ncbi:MAG: NADH-ubiquinone oxidoreductase chain D, partial [uncultured Gemmatimonadaceae bacterium]